MFDYVGHENRVTLKVTILNMLEDLLELYFGSREFDEFVGWFNSKSVAAILLGGLAEISSAAPEI
jgi:hypothetical protein